MRRTSSKNGISRQSSDHWLSFSDLMSALLLVFVLIMFYSVYQYLDMLEIKTAELARQSGLLSEKEELLAVQNEELEASKSKLSESEKELIANQAKLLLFEKQLNSSEELLSQQRSELDSQSELLAEQQQQLASAQSALSVQQSQLTSAQELLTEKEDYIASQQQTLERQQQQMLSQQSALDAIVGVKSKIISDLAQKLQQANIRATVDEQTGSITLDASVLFDVGKSKLKESGKRILDQFLPVYLSVVMNGEYAESVSEIIIEGHTDDDGTYISNLALSQQRALSVMQYILSDNYNGINTAMKRRLRNIATANGRSFSNPIYTANGLVDKTASRRVEFKFRLQDEQMIESMRRILEGMD